MVAPDGELLSNCDAKKVQWYIEKGLGDIISENPLTVKLKFEPNGRINREKNELFDDSFYAAKRSNVCVVCAAGEDYSRFHVVPALYR